MRLFGYGTGWLIELCFDSFTGQTLWHQLIISGNIKHRLLRLEYSFISKATPPPLFVQTLISKNMPCVSHPYPPPHPYPPLPIHITHFSLHLYHSRHRGPSPPPKKSLPFVTNYITDFIRYCTMSNSNSIFHFEVAIIR